MLHIEPPCSSARVRCPLNMWTQLQQRHRTPKRTSTEARAAGTAQDSSKRKLLQRSAALLLAPLCVRAESPHPPSVQDVITVLRSDFVERQYYVTGRLSSSIFANDCVFTDPTTSVQGRQKYGSAVASLFDPSKSKADLITLKQLGDKKIELKWRVEAALNIPGRPKIKPYLGTTTYTLDGTNMIIKQEEDWSISALDAIVSLLFPGFGAPAADPIDQILTRT